MSNCDCWIYESPSVYRDEMRKAKKPYECCDCRATINPGDRYLYVFGVWDNHASTHRMCVLCEDMRQQCEFACAPFGELANDVYQCQNPQAGEVVAFKRRYEASRC
jgi:hypothetical protein